MGTKMKNSSWFAGDDHWEAEDDAGHRGSGSTPEQAQQSLEDAQEAGAEWITPLFAGREID